MTHIVQNAYTASLADTPEAIEACLALRAKVFRDGAPDRDAFDAQCRHICVRDAASGTLAACARVMILPSGAQISQSYSAQFYGLDNLSTWPTPMAELGRVTLASDAVVPDAIRHLWAMLTTLVEAAGVTFLFGCASFEGARREGRTASLAYLSEKYAPPAALRPLKKSPQALAFPDCSAAAPALDIPPLLRAYLSMGAWISDHGVCDDDLDTFHVFTGLDLAAIPERRKQALRALAAG